MASQHKEKMPGSFSNQKKKMQFKFTRRLHLTSLRSFLHTDTEKLLQYLCLFLHFGNTALKPSLVKWKVFTKWADISRGLCIESDSVGHSAPLPHFKHQQEWVCVCFVLFCVFFVLFLSIAICSHPGHFFLESVFSRIAR